VVVDVPIKISGKAVAVNKVNILPNPSIPIK
jgi:hypothetical protein